jgi:hypothetical protein
MENDRSLLSDPFLLSGNSGPPPMISFCPLSADGASGSDQPLAYILQIDDVRILLDCGSPEWSTRTHKAYTDLLRASVSHSFLFTRLLADV